MKRPPKTFSLIILASCARSSFGYAVSINPTLLITSLLFPCFLMQKAARKTKSKFFFRVTRGGGGGGKGGKGAKIKKRTAYISTSLQIET